jgi:hypothetical protein
MGKKRIIDKKYASGTLSVRFTPKLRYQLEIAARVYHRNLSNFIEDCIRERLKKVKIFPYGDQSITIDNYIDQLWDIDEHIRLIKLKSLAPHLLSYEEEKHLRELEKINK